MNVCLSAALAVRREIKKKIKLHQDNRINKREFREFVFRVVSLMPGADEFDYFIDFLLSNVEVQVVTIYLWVGGQIEVFKIFIFY